MKTKTSKIRQIRQTAHWTPQFKIVTGPASSAPKPDAYYAQFAQLFRERGLEVADTDYELIDVTIKACNHFLDQSSWLV